MRPLLLGAALLAPLLLGSCTMSYPVKAFFLGGQLAFVSEDVGLDARSCRFSFTLFDGSGRRVWDFREGKLSSSQNCRDGTPLIYGQVPSGVDVKKPAEPLRAGTIYVIEGHSYGNLYGAFTIYRGGGKLVVRNLRADSDEIMEIRNRGWQPRTL